MLEVLQWICTIIVVLLLCGGVGLLVFIMYSVFMFGPSGSKVFLKNTLLNIIHPNRNHTNGSNAP
jgi:hypothetical protein